MNADWQERATHLKAPRANGPWRAEQGCVRWAHWASGMGCSHRACVASASCHPSAPAGLPWALGPEESWLREGTPDSSDTAARVKPQSIAEASVTCGCKLLSWTELCCWPPVNTHTALYPAGRECLSNLTRLSWCPSAQHHRVWTSPTLCKAVQDPDQQQPHQMDPLTVIIVTLCGRS